MSARQLDWIEPQLQSLQQRTLRRFLRQRESPPVGGMVQLDGRQLVNFGSNDYLGLASCSRLVNAVQRAVGYCGWGSGSSPLIEGRAVMHARLERELAAFESAEAALLFPTGFAANVGVITSLASQGDVILSDAKNHASIIDGCRLAGARTEIYRHNDVDHLRQLLQDARSAPRRLIVTDSLFSMDGDLAPLPALAELAEQYDAMLMVDEAHATGVLGEHGRGCVEFMGVESGVHIRVGTLSKALGSIGGFVVGEQRLVDWLANQARTYIFSTAFPEVAAAAGIEALRMVIEEPQRRWQLVEKSARLRQRLADLDFDTGQSASQIVPVRLGAADEAIRLGQQLHDAGFFVPAVRPPSVPDGQSLLRISVCSDHAESKLDELCDQLIKLR